jgi:hypothetical protein
MNKDQETILIIKGAIAAMSTAEQEACYELAEHFRQSIKCAGVSIGTLAIALVGAEMQEACE